MHLCAIIVDDEKAPRDLLAEFLPWEELGFATVKTADDGESALHIAEEFPPDVIISDIKMPHMNGIELARCVRQRWPECRFVFLSGYPNKEHLKDAIKLKAASFVEKPIDLAELAQLLRELAAECRAVRRCDPRTVFFRGTSGSDAPLNTQSCTLTKAELTQLATLVKSKNQEAAMQRLDSLLKKLQDSEGTGVSYIRNILCRFVLILVDAADAHNVKKVSEQRDTLLYSIAHAATFTELSLAVTALAQEFFEAVGSQSLGLVARVDRYLETHYTQPDLTVQSVADDLGFVNTYLCMAYKKASGKTVNEQLTRLRIAKAQQLLLSTDRKLYEIGGAVGYSDPQYFTRVFTKEVGVSPRRYREVHTDEP